MSAPTSRHQAAVGLLVDGMRNNRWSFLPEPFGLERLTPQPRDSAA